jgi:hypothetical protein
VHTPTAEPTTACHLDDLSRLAPGCTHAAVADILRVPRVFNARHAISGALPAVPAQLSRFALLAETSDMA